MRITGNILRAAAECAAKPSKDRPEFWCSRVRVAHYAKKVSVVEATNGIVLVRIELETDHEGEAYVTRDVLSRIKPTDSCEIEGLDLHVEAEDGSVDVRASLLEIPEPVLMVGGKNIRQWPDFDAAIPKGKRAAASMIGLSSAVMGKVSRATKHLSTAEQPLELRMEAGGAAEPLKFHGRAQCGQVTFVVMPVSMVTEESGQEKPDGATT